MTKGICDLRKILHKAQVRLTQVGSLIVRCLGYIYKCAVYQQVRRLLFAKTPPNRFRGAIIFNELSRKALAKLNNEQ